MIRRIFFVLTIAATLAFLQTPFAQQTADENAKTRPNKQEILDLMLKAGKMPAAQKNSKLAAFWQGPPAGETPRSDFLFCTALAYMGNYRAQRCVASAYENGRGIVEDQSEAYAWYAVALDNEITDTADRQALEADKDRVQNRLLAAYPHPSEDELEDMVRAQKNRISQYQDDLNKAQK